MSYMITIWTEHRPNEAWFVLRLRDVLKATPFETRVRDSRWAKSRGVDGLMSDGIVETTKTGKTGFVTRIEISQVLTKEHYDNGSRKTRYLDHPRWIEFNHIINDWLDTLGASAEVKSSSYVIRTRKRRRETFLPGDYHGAQSTWRDVAPVTLTA